MEKINRSNVNSSHVKSQDFPKSGFDLSYKSRIDFIIGRLHPSGFQYVMPADKFSGSNDSKLTFNRLVVPEISDVEVSQHNFYVPFRAIDSTFIQGIVPTELNGMSASWRVPSFTLADMVSGILLNINNVAFPSYHITYLFSSLLNTSPQTQSDWDTYITGCYTRLESLLPSFKQGVYLDDWWQDYTDWVLNYPITRTLPSNLQGFKDVAIAWLDALLRPLVGEGSLLDLLGYNYIRYVDYAKIVDNMFTDYDQSQDVDDPTFAAWVGSYCDDCPMSEYAIRAYYAIWYEWYRDSNLEKRSAYLTDWRDFGSTSILFDSSVYRLDFLCTRIRSWQKDMFVGSMPDDISRHVYSPIVAPEKNQNVSILSDNIQYLNAEQNAIEPGVNGYVNATSYYLSYIDPTTGTAQNVVCPLPKAINDSLSTLSASQSNLITYGLDLRDLRKSQMLERYLKRNFYFGDEYQDRMLAHYGSKISDNSIRRPHLLSSSVDSYNPTQEVASVGTSETPVGTRTATATAQGSNDGFEFFAEEFGIVINIISVMPRAQYAGICPQNLLSQMTDFPLPEFANNNDEFGRVMEVATSGLKKSSVFDLGMFGHYPYAHAWRSRVDEVHGSWLHDKSNWTFRRFFGMDQQDGAPRLNYRFIHCRPNLGMFANTNRLDGQGYMTVDHHFYVERVLPTPVEEI